MADQPQPYENADPERRTPVKNDLAPEGMDSESEGDELEASAAGEAEAADQEFKAGEHDDHVEPDGVRDSPKR